MEAVLASLPIAGILILMVGFGWSAVKAGLVAAVGTLVLAAVTFGFGGVGDGFSLGEGVVGVIAEAAFVTLTVVAIIGPALGIHHLQQHTGATEVLREGLGRLSSDPRIGALLVAWFFTLFLEGAAGFGTPVALAAPFLVAAGFTPLAAVTAAMVGHAAAVSFGAVGTPVLVQATISQFTGRELARATTPYHTALGWLLVAVVVVIIGRTVSERPPWLWGALAGVAFFVPYAAIGTFVGPELPSLGGALIGASIFVGVVLATRKRRRVGPSSSGGVPVVDGGRTSGVGVLIAGSPYVSLVVLVLVTRLVPPIRGALTGVEVEWSLFGDFRGSVQPLYHPGLLLLLAFFVGAAIQRADRRAVARAIGLTNTMLAPVVVALVAMVTVARTMSQAGMTDTLAVAAAGAGAAWPLLAPMVGALGTFVTGSATASNILFTDFQASTAAAVGRPALPLLGAQTFGAAVGNIICPHNIVAAAATVGLSGHEGSVLRRTLPVAAGYVMLGGALAWWLVG